MREASPSAEKNLEKWKKQTGTAWSVILAMIQELFHGSVEENIRLGGKEGAEEMIRVCLPGR